MTTQPPTRTTEAAPRETSRVRESARILIGVLLTEPDRRFTPPRPRSPRPLFLLFAALVLAFLITTIALGVTQLDPTMSPTPAGPGRNPGPTLDPGSGLGPPIPQLALFISAGLAALVFFQPLWAWRLATLMMVCWMLIFQHVLGELWPFWTHYLLILFVVAARQVRWVAMVTTVVGLAALSVTLLIIIDAPAESPPVGVLLFSALASVLLGGTIGTAYEKLSSRFRSPAIEDPKVRARREEQNQFIAESGRIMRAGIRRLGALAVVVLFTGTDSALAPRRQMATPWRRRLIVLFFLLIATITTITGLIGSVNQSGWADFLVLASGALCLLALPLPLVAWRLSLVGIVVAFSALPEYVGQMLGTWLIVMITLVLVAYHHTSRVTALVGTVTVAVVSTGSILATDSWGTINLGGVLLSVIVVLLLGYSLGSARRARRDLATEEKRAAEAQAEQVRLSERNRIAREMHDVVAHHMSMIAVRSETAPYRLPDLSESGRTELAEIGTAARAAMSDMQRLLGVLRENNHRPDKAPQPGLAELADLVSTSRDSGIPVTLRMQAEVVALVAEPLGLTVYRIAQEALTNAGRYAPDAPIEIEIDRQGDTLIVAVRNEPPSRSPTAATRRSGGGHGLAGMRERVALHDGELRAGPTGDGGFEVRAMLPLTAAQAHDVREER